MTGEAVLLAKPKLAVLCSAMVADGLSLADARRRFYAIDRDGLLVDGARATDVQAPFGGASWQSFREGLPQEHCYDVIYRHSLDVSGDRLCFGTTTGNAYVSEDRGETWRCLGNNLPPVHSVRFA